MQLSRLAVTNWHMHVRNHIFLQGAVFMQHVQTMQLIAIRMPLSVPVATQNIFVVTWSHA